MPPGACPGDARGEAPCIKKLKFPPSPEGKGGGGMGAEEKGISPGWTKTSGTGEVQVPRKTQEQLGTPMVQDIP